MLKRQCRPRRHRRGVLVTCGGTLLAFLLLLCCPGLLRAGSPTLSNIVPRGGQRGTEVETTFQGTRLDDAVEVMLYEPGISVVSLTQTNNTALSVRLKLDPAARLGTHVLRVRTKSGLSDARTFSVGQFPVLPEQEPNNDFAAPQKVSLNSTIHGIAENEDIDYYLVEAKKGQRITAEVEAMRLGSALTDCYVAILDQKRFELAACDDSAFALQDPVASILVPEDGSYVVAVRESSYSGNRNSHYCLHLGESPRPIAVYPAGGKAGGELEARFIGDVRGEIAQKVYLPPEAAGDFDYFLSQDNLSAPSPNRLRATAAPNALETEPNNALTNATTAELDLPIALNGIIGADGDQDFFRFKAKSGTRFDVRCVARGIRSPLDPVLTLFKADGGQLAQNDDSGGPDSLINWTVPADGEYIVSVRDHLGKGGSNYIYRVEFAPVQPALTLGIPEFVRNSQERNTVAIPQGNRFGTVVRVTRANFGGDVTVQAGTTLPAGVSMACEPIIGSVNEIPVVFEAAPDAALGGQLLPLVGTYSNQTEVTGGFRQTLELIYGPPNNTIYYKTSVDKLALAVTEAVPFKITAVEPKVPLVQGGSMGVKVVAERKEGFKAPIKLQMLWTPPRIGAQNEVTIPEGQSEAIYPLNANGDAALRSWKIAFLASSDPGKGPVWVSTQLFPLTIAAPYLSMRIPMAAGEQGTNVAILCKIQHLQPFEGEAMAQLHGLPPKVQLATNTLPITKDTAEIMFNATIAPDAPIGQHKTLFCQVIITSDGEPITHSVGRGGILRIDPPPPPKPNQPVAAPAPAAAPPAVAKAEPPPKPLSRLEKLRLEAKAREK